MKKLALRAISIVGLTCAVNALADDGNWYIAGGLGGTDVSALIFDTQNAMISKGATRFSYAANQGIAASRLQAGYMFLPHWAVEAGFVNLGDFKYTASGGNLAAPVSLSSHIKATYVDAVAILPFTDHAGFFAKLGLAHTTSTGVTALPLAFAGTSVNGLTGGLGLKYEFSNGVSIQYEQDSYNVHASSVIGVGTFNLGYRF